MYNRYVPQPDGSYRRNRIQDPQRAVAQSSQQTIPQEAFGNVQMPLLLMAGDCEDERNNALLTLALYLLL